MILLAKLCDNVFRSVGWINQPSTLQEYHQHHGQYVLTTGPQYDRSTCLILIDGEVRTIHKDSIVIADYEGYIKWYKLLRSNINKQ